IPHISDFCAHGTHQNLRRPNKPFFATGTLGTPMACALSWTIAQLISFSAVLTDNRREGGFFCQRRSKNASAGRSKNTSAMLAGRPRTGGLFFGHQAWVGLSTEASALARRERRLL